MDHILECFAVLKETWVTVQGQNLGGLGLDPERGTGGRCRFGSAAEPPVTHTPHTTEHSV